MQTQIINPLKRWATILNAIFCPDKSYMIYFIRNRKKLSLPRKDMCLALNGVAIKPFFRLKLLKIVLNQRFSYQRYISKIVKKKVLATLILKWLKNLRPKTVQRLYNSTVISVTNYILIICAPNISKFALYQFFQV